nr:14582_t:CDS:2 [Entrophospora candida]
MTHTSDFSYLSRAMSTAYTSLWFLQHVWFIDRFASLRWNRVKRFELKSVITLLLLLICPLEAIYDISIVVIKYQEGYLPDPFNPGEYRPKIQPYWSKKNQDFVVPINYVLCANLSVQTCLLFLLQSFWNYLASSLTRSSFMGSLEFKSYILFSICSAILFPTLQFCFSSNQLNSELAPQFAYGIIMLIIALLGFRSDYRFKKLLMHTRRLNPTVNVLRSASLTALSIDALTTAKYLNITKFYADLLMVQLNFSIWVVFVSLMLIFYPAKINDTPSPGSTVAFDKKSNRFNFLKKFRF